MRESLGYTWYLVKCIDPDGTRLNEGWFKGPFSIENLARHYYRPPAYQQVAWTLSLPPSVPPSGGDDPLSPPSGGGMKGGLLEEQTGTDPAEIITGGTLSLEYARAFCDRMSFIRPFTLGCLLSPICERPYFYHPAIEDTSASDRVRRDAILPDAVDRCGRLIRKR